MIRTIICMMAAGLTAALLSIGASARPEATPVLKGIVGPGFTISLKLNGRRVRTLKAGRYNFVIADRASSHNFALEQKSGGRFEKNLTGVAFVGRKTMAVRLKRGKWKFYCGPHEAAMFGAFTVK